MKTLLIDGDVIAYQFSTAAEVAIHWGDDFWTLHADAAEAKVRLASFMGSLMSELEATDLIVALSDSSRQYFRKAILPTYKQSRDGVRKPIILAEMRKHLQETYPTFERPGLEGDDVLGILATSKKIVPGEKVIVSIDKDLLTIPGLHYNTRHPEKGVFMVTLDEADYFHLFQTLTGDSSDGYSGCPGIGPKRAEQILALCDGDKSQLWGLVVDAYVKAGFSEAEALTQARVARILRADDYDFTNKKPVLWSPKA